MTINENVVLGEVLNDFVERLGEILPLLTLQGAPIRTTTMMKVIPTIRTTQQSVVGENTLKAMAYVALNYGCRFK
jgi:chorismate synthase